MTKRRKKRAKKQRVKKNTESKRSLAPAERTYPKSKILQKELFGAADITRFDVERAKISWRELGAIYEDHSRRTADLSDVADLVASKLRRPQSVHSVRARIKKPGSLIHKIVRKRGEDPERDIRFDNYRSQISDLIGIRALHLFKHEWRPIHEYVTETWGLRDTPTANYRKGDHQPWLDQFEAAGCRLEQHERQYRSVHYLLTVGDTKAETVVELQTRTIFEEAWSEVDHRINYPIGVPYAEVGRFLQVFNRLAGSADELGSFINDLLIAFRVMDERADRAESEREVALEAVQQLVEELGIKEAQRADLKRRIKALSDASPSIAMKADPGSFEIEGSEAGLRLSHSFSAVDFDGLAHYVGLGGGRLENICAVRCRHCGAERSGATVSPCPSCGLL